MWRMIIGQSLYQIFVLLFTLYGAQVFPFLGIEGMEETNYQTGQTDVVRNTIVFNSFVLCQLFNEINCRFLGDGKIYSVSLIFAERNVFKGVLKNWIFLAVVGGSTLVQFLLVQFGGTVVKTTALTFVQWVFCLFLGGFSIPFGK
jgi:Ca2+-transporting ATPase